MTKLVGRKLVFEYKKLAFSKQADQFLIKTLNFDKQAEKFFITPVEKTKKC